MDALGELQDSVRRSDTQGLQFKYTLNAEGPADQVIDVFVLDERYERDPLPCGVRREWSGILSETVTSECEGQVREGAEAKAPRKAVTQLLLV